VKIKTKILCTLFAMPLLVALVGALAVDRQRASVTTAATKEAENVADVLGFIFLSDSNQLHSSTQEIISRLHEAQGRDVVLMDAQQTILADVDRSEVGKNYAEDPNNEAGATLKDGNIRTFIETSSNHPAGIKQIVVPIKSNSGQIIGAVVLEYAPLFNELMQLTKTTTKQIALTTFGSVIFALLIAFFMGRSVARPLQQLTEAATAFAAGKTGLPLPPPRSDEIGQLARAFNDMVQKRELAEVALRNMNNELEGRVAGRTAELVKTNNALHMENTERKQAEQELRWKTAFLEAQTNSSIDGILVVDGQGKSLLQNQRLVDLWKMPQPVADEIGDENRLRWVRDMVKNPVQFTEKVVYLYSHPNEISVDEIGLKDGTILDRYSSPVIGKDGTYYGRIWTFRDITERKRTEVSLRLLESAVEQTKESIVITDAELDLPGPRILFINPAFTKITGYNEEEVLGKTPRILQGPQTDKAVLSRLRQNLERGKVFEGETINYRKDGKAFHLEWQIAPVRNTTGKITHFVAIQHDITERKRLEGQLFQSQKLETVGKLAGGFAHEFNSILTAIIGQSELLLGDLPKDSPLANNATEIRKAAGRAATLTRQLLAYGRKQILQPETLDLNRVAASMESMIRLLLGGNVDLQMAPFINLHSVKADAGQIEQVIMNMVINARDAMPNGGKLMLETANVSFDAESVGRYPELKPGDYAMLAITDTGTGMAEEVKVRIFEPFFSTKGVGQGTGLGLSTCYGIIKQSGGHISVYSELARGATFKIYLPRVELQLNNSSPRLDSRELPRGTETILLVEDDSALREMAMTLLRRLGYTVWAAANGIEALSLKQQRGTGHIDLLFTDVVMPHMSGKELADRMQVISPHTKILFSSAYTENTIVHQGVLIKGVSLLQKPFTPSALAHKLRQVLDHPPVSKPEPTAAAWVDRR
jgi:PAS domain S-box-containing protein